MRKYLIITVTVICTNLTNNITAQQYDPLYTQYMFNSQMINPAYAGTSDFLSAMLMSRHQWVGFPDAPNTQTFSIHSPITSNNVGAGLSLIYDKIGPVISTNISMDYSYRFKISESVKISLGLKGSIAYFQKNLEKYWGELGNDPAYFDNVSTKILPNFGFGIYCYSNRFYAGATIPRLIENVISDDGSVSSVARKENRPYIMMAGGVFGITPTVKLKPSFILRMSNTTPFSYDLNLNALILEMLWVGGMFRPKEGYGAMFQVQITNQLRIGYAFEMTTHQLKAHHSGTHEIMITYDFVFRKENVQNPRYF